MSMDVSLLSIYLLSAKSSKRRNLTAASSQNRQSPECAFCDISMLPQLQSLIGLLVK